MTQVIAAPDTSVAEGKIINAVRTMIAKSRPGVGPDRARPASIVFEWTGGGLPIVQANTDPVLVEVPMPCRIVWAHLYAGDVVGNPVATTATVNVQLTSLTTFGASTPLYGSGAIPALVSDSATNLDLTDWHRNLVTTDTLIGRLATFSGAATWLVLVLQLRPTDVPIGVSAVTDDAGDPFTDADGNALTFRA